MKIAIVINTSWNIYNFRMGLIRALQKKGHQIYAIAPPDDYSDYLVAGGCQYWPIQMDNSGNHPIRDIILWVKLYQAYKNIQPDLILHYTIKPNIYGSLAARLLGIKMINNVSGLGTVFIQKGWVTTIAKYMYRWAFRFPQKIFFQNRDDCDMFINQKLVRPEKAEIIPGSGINTRKYEPSPELVDRPFTFLLISRLLIEKGIVEYTEAIGILLKKHIDARFWLLGATEFEHKRGIKAVDLEKWENDGILQYLGAVVDVRPIIEQADCVVLPSYREGLPKSLLEAASMEKPLIASDVPGCKEVVMDQINGLLCRVKDPDDLAAKMMQIYRMDENARKGMGQKGRLLVTERFSEDLVIQKYLVTIDALIANL